MSTEEFLLARIRELEAKVAELEEWKASRLAQKRAIMKKCRMKHHGGTTVAPQEKHQQNQQTCGTTVAPQIGMNFAKDLVKPSLKKDIYISSGIPEDHPDFAEFWKWYPRKVGKHTASKAYSKARKEGACKEEILKGVTSLRSSQTELKFIPHASTWLNQKRWNDEAAHISPKNNVIRINKSGIPGVDW